MSPAGRISTSGWRAHASMTAWYRCSSNGAPNRMLSRNDKFWIHACCATYATVPYRHVSCSQTTAVQLKSYKIIINNVHFTQKYNFCTNTIQCNITTRFIYCHEIWTCRGAVRKQRPMKQSIARKNRLGHMAEADTGCDLSVMALTIATVLRLPSKGTC